MGITQVLDRFSTAIFPKASHFVGAESSEKAAGGGTILLIPSEASMRTRMERSGGFFPSFRFDLKEALLALDHVFIDDIPRARLLIRQAIHQIEHDLFANGPQSASTRVALQRALGNQFQSPLREFDFTAFDAEELLVLLHERIPRLGEDVDQRPDIQRF